jgi:hypothetical protein
MIHHMPRIADTIMKNPAALARFGLFLCFAFSNPAHGQGADNYRVWKSADGKTVEAAFIALEGESVKIKGKNGAVFSVPLTRLSPEDQTWARSQAAPAASTTANPATTADSPPAEKTWPRSVGLDDKPEVTVVKEDAATKEFIYRSPHYEFICDSRLGANVVREFGRMFEATYLLNCKLPLDLKPKPEPLREFFQAKLFTNEDDYMKDGGLPGSAGIYMRSDKALKVPLSSLGVKMVGSRVTLDKAGDDDNATLIHEITHQMMNHWLRHLPTWFTEGSAEYTEILEYNASGRFTLSGLRGRLKDYAQQANYWQTGPMKMLDLKELMEIESDAWAAALERPVKIPDVTGATQAGQNYGSAGLLTYYFYHVDGKGDAANIIAWLRDIEAGGREVDEPALTKKHLLRERTYEQLAADVKKGLKKEGIDVEFDAPGQNGGSSGSSN